MHILASLLVELLLVASCILLLFNFRKKIGLAPLYILLGTLQYFQANLENMVGIKIFGQYPMYPGSIVLFSALLFAVLLIYIKEGVKSARTLIIGILLSNIFLTGLFEITATQDYFIRNQHNEFNLSTDVFFILNYKYFLIGTAILLLDFILMAIIYQFLITRIKKTYFFITILLSLLIVLLFDGFVFSAMIYHGTNQFTVSLIGHVIGKSFAALLYSIILYIYLTFIDKELSTSTFIANQRRDIFSILSYEQKYLDLKIEKENNENKLKAQFEKTLTSISDGIVTLDKNWCYTYVNKQAGEFLGRTPESLIGKHIWTEFPEGVGLPFYHAYLKAFESQKIQILQEHYAPLDKWFDNRIYPSLDGLTIYFTDINEKKQIENALNESEALNKGILSSLSAHIAVIDKTGEILAVNKAWNDFAKNNGDQHLERTSVGSNYIVVCQQAIEHGDLLSQNVMDGILAVLNKDLPRFEIGYPCHTNSEKRWFTMHVEPFGTKSDKLVIAHNDVTKLKLTEEKLGKTNLQLNEAQRMAKIGNWEFNPITKTVFFSDELYNILEIDKNTTQNLYEAYKSICLPGDLGIINELVHNSIKNENGYTHGYYIKTNNKLKYIQEIGVIIKDASGENINLKGTIQDITKEKLVNDKLIQNNEKLTKANSELDRFVYSASHDLRSPLTSLRGLIHIIEMNTSPENDEDKKPFYLMHKTIDKMDKFIADILDYSKNARTGIAHEKINFDTLIKSCWEDLEFMFIDYKPKSKVTITQLGDFYSDQKRIEIIVNNLISNAFKYHDTNKAAHFVNITITVNDKKAILEIEDNGIGISEDNIDKIFNMFHRVTSLSTGSGMGLYILKETLEKLEGTISVDSELKKGTKFTIEIPNSLKHQPRNEA